MSDELLRYDFDDYGVCYRTPTGPFVSYDNSYAPLEAENARLKAEIERLTKAADAMAARLMYHGYPQTVQAWNEAKGVQS